MFSDWTTKLNETFATEKRYPLNLADIRTDICNYKVAWLPKRLCLIWLFNFRVLVWMQLSVEFWSVLDQLSNLLPHHSGMAFLTGIHIQLHHCHSILAWHFWQVYIYSNIVTPFWHGVSDRYTFVVSPLSHHSGMAFLTGIHLWFHHCHTVMAWNFWQVNI